MLFFQSCFLLWSFLIQLLFKTAAKCSSGNLASSRGDSNSILIQILYKMLFLYPCIHTWWFLIQFLFKTNAKCSSGNLASSWRRFLFSSNSKLMQNTLLSTLLPPVVVSSILIKNWCKMLFRLPWLLLWWFLIQFLFKTDAKCYSFNLASSCGRFLFTSYSKLMQNAPLANLHPHVVILIQFLFKTNAKCSSGNLASSWRRFLFSSHSKLMQNTLLSTLLPPVVCSSSILIKNWCKMLFQLPWLLLWWFLIQFLFKTDAKCSPGHLASTRNGF